MWALRDMTHTHNLISSSSVFHATTSLVRNEAEVHSQGNGELSDRRNKRKGKRRVDPVRRPRFK